MTAAIHYIALLGTIMSASLILPALVGFGAGENELAIKLLVFSLLGIFLFFSVLIAAHKKAHILNRVSRVYLVVISWLLFPLLIAIPLSDALSIPFSHAIFEAVSAFTTTASNSIANTEALPSSAIWLRAQVQWFGGLATLATFVFFLGPMKMGGLQYSGASYEHAINISSEASFFRNLWRLAQFYLSFSVLCFVILLMTGLKPFESAILTSTAVSSGGYLPSSESVLDFVSPVGMMVLALFFLIAATSVFWHRSILDLQLQKIRKATESWSILIAFVIMSLILFSYLSDASGQGTGNQFLSLTSEAIFNAASLISTSGVESRPGVYALISPILVMAILLVGAGCYSTAGGIKHFRFYLMFQHAKSELKSLIYPHGIDRTTAMDTDADKLQTKMVWVLFCAAIALIGLGAIGLSITGLSFEASLIASITSFSNAGPAYSPEWAERGAQGWPTYSEMILEQKMILSALMIFGRLEIIAIFTAFNPFYWIRK